MIRKWPVEYDQELQPKHKSFCYAKAYTDRKNVTNVLYLVLRLARKVTCYFRLFSLGLISVLRTRSA